jgi:hypothetical protein
MTIPLANTDHAFLAGVIAGHLLDHGVSLDPCLDDDGNYTAQWTITVPGPLAGADGPVEVMLVVLPQGSTVEGPKEQPGS